MIEVYFDGKCGLCSREIRYYRSIAPSNIFDWLDIASDPSPLVKYNITQADALRRLHVRDNEGKWHKGVMAFIVIWGQLRYWSILSKIVSLPFILHVAIIIYNGFADIRFAKSRHCQISQNLN